MAYRRRTAAETPTLQAARPAPTRNTVLIVTAATRAAADRAVVAVAGGFAAGSFSVPYSNDDGATITHYGCAWRMSDDEFTAVQAALARIASSQVLERGRDFVVTPRQEFTELGLILMR